MNNTEALNVIYINLKKGKRYGYMVRNVRYPYFHTDLMYDGQYWCWHNYGSSANRATKKELKWIIETIYKMSPVEFINNKQLKGGN